MNQLAPNKGALYSYAPIIWILSCAEYKREGLSPYYGIIILMCLITIGANNKEDGLKYDEILCQDRAGEEMSINVRPLK